MSYRMARTLSRIAKLGEKAVARSNCAQNRNILFKCPRWSKETVSIHAPVWGATWVHQVRSSGSQRFQSTPPYGGRLEPVSVRPNWKSSFNPRLDTIIKVDGKEK